MPRNGSGTYTLPAGNPVVTATVISSTVQNNTMNDVATALTDSVDKDGQTVLTGALDFGSNNALNMAILGIQTEIQHDGDTNNKIAFGTDTQDFQTGGSSRMDLSDTGMQLGGANARVTTVLDEDTMSSDSATALITQQSAAAFGNPTTHTTAVVVAADEFTFSDVGSSNAIKKDTVQGILDLVPAASDTVAGLSEYAVQSEMETATSNVLTVTPGRVQNHPGVAKAWLTFAGSDGAISTNYNITSNSRTSAGLYVTTIATDFSTVNYTVSGTGRRDTGGGVYGQLEVHSASSNPAVGAVTIRSLSSAFAATDMEFNTAVFHGDQ